jgi:predicted hydrocarbon binding protein
LKEGRLLEDRFAKLSDFYTLDYRTGAIFNQLTEERVQVIPAQMWKALRNLLRKDFPKEEEPHMMYEIGSALGLSFAEEMMKQISDPEVIGRRLPDMAAASGWGIFSWVGDLRYGSKFTASVANCVFCDKEKPADSPQCDILIGMIKGAADVIFGEPHKVSETRCQAMGDSVCLVETEETRS